MRTFVRNIMLLAMLLAGTTTIAVAADKKATTTTAKYAGKVKHLTKAEFDKLVCNTANGTWKYIGDKPCVIDFYATWCGPCKQLAPILDELEQKHKGDVIFKRVDVDQEPDLANEFHVEAIPMLMFVTPKGDYQTIMGYQEAAVIEAKIAELLARSAK